MITQRDLKVFLDGWEHDVLAKVRSESVSKIEFKDMVEEHLQQVAELQGGSNLPDVASAYAVADDLLLQIRKQAMQF